VDFKQTINELSEVPPMHN